MKDEVDHPKQGSITIVEHETHFYTLSRYFVASISTESERIQKFTKGLASQYQLAIAQIIVLRTSF